MAVEWGCNTVIIQMRKRPDLELELKRWLAHRVPQEWFAGEPHLRVDREEILVTGELEPPSLSGEVPEPARLAAVAARIESFRTATRDHRVLIATEAEHLFGRSLSWGVRCGGSGELFTMLSVPVMTRLRMPERAVLDTLVESGVARSRSDALAWCVRLVGKHEGDWIAELRDALVQVESVRAAGPRG
jgi:hypothetical protein